MAAFTKGDLKTTGAPWLWSRDSAGLDEAPISTLASQCSSGDGCPKCHQMKAGAEWLDTGAGKILFYTQYSNVRISFKI